MPAFVPVINAPQVEASPIAGDDYARVNASPAAFGGTVGEAASGLGLSLQQQGKELEGAAQFGDQINNETWATKALTDASGQMADASAKFYSLHGEAAVNAYPGYIKQIQGIHDDVLGGMPSPAAKAMAGQAMGYRMSMAFLGAGRFVAGQRLNWNLQATTASSIQNATDAVNHRTDPTAAASFIQAGAENVAHVWALKGGDPQTQQIMSEQYVGSAAERVVQSLALDGNAAAAQAFFDSVRRSMDPASQVRVAAFLHPHVESAKARMIVNSAAYSGPIRLPATTPLASLADAVTLVESGGHQFAPDGSPLTSDKGAAGRMQVTPGAVQDVAAASGLPYTFDQARTNPAVNTTIGTGYLSLNLKRFGDPTLAVAAYNAGPAAVQAAIAKFGDPRTGAIGYRAFLSHLPPETQQYVAKVSAQLNLAAGIGTTDVAPANPLDPQAFLAKVGALTAGESLGVQRRAMADAHLYLMRQQASGAQARAAVRVQVGTTANALWNGQAAPIPVDRINAAYPPVQAKQLIDNLQVAQAGGLLLKSLQWASPQQIAAVETDLTSGNGHATDALRTAGGIGLGPDGRVLPADEAADFASRQRVLGLLEQKLHARAMALRTDPATFVLGDSNVRADYEKAIASNNPADFGAYAVAATALETHLGVPADKQFVLPAPDAQKIATDLLTIDPVAAASKLGALAHQFGSAWPKVFGQLVAQQHLPGDLRVIPALTAPGQATVQADLVRANQVMHDKGGEAAWLKTLGPGASGQVEKAIGLNGTMRQYQNSLMVRGTVGQPGVWSAVHDAVQRLSLYYVGQGMSAVEAVGKAAQGVIGLKYQFDGTARYPRGLGPQVQQRMAALEGSMKPEQLSAQHYAPAQASIVADAPKVWITNAADDGLVMAYRDNSGVLRRVWGANGQPIGFTFGSVQHALPSEMLDPGAPPAAIGGGG